MDSEEQIAKLVSSNDLILRNIFNMVSLAQLKPFRLVCKHWRDLSEFEFKKRSILTLNFNPDGNEPVSVFHELEEMKMYWKFPRDSFFFKGPIRWTDSTLMQFFQEYGKQIKVLKVDIDLKNVSSPAELQPLRQIVNDYLPNVEKLSLAWKNVKSVETIKFFSCSSLNGIIQSRCTITIPRSIPLVTRYPRGHPLGPQGPEEERIWCLTQIERHLFEIFCRLIANSVFLVNLSFSDAFCLAKYRLRFPKAEFLKSLTITSSGEPVLNPVNLMSLSVQGLQLNSLTVESLNPLHLKSFFEFLDTQKNCLKKMAIEWLPAMDSQTTIRYPQNQIQKFQFPKMQLLEVLEFHCEKSKIMWTSPMYDRDWVNQFPALKKFKCRFGLGCDDAVAIDENRVSIYFNPSVLSTVVSINKEINWDSYSRLTNANLDKCYRVSKEKFPNLENIKIIEQEHGTNKSAVYYYDGNLDSSYFYLSYE